MRRVDGLLGSVIKTNPHAVAIAAQRDNERRAGRVRGPLHGIPVLVKDNIATDDRHGDDSRVACPHRQSRTAGARRS